MFENIVGNEKIKKDLQTAIQIGRTSHSYLFIGNKGIGKALFAKEFAKALLCEKSQTPCLHCKSCIEFDHGNHPDFYYIGLGEENSIKIETIRKMQAKIQELPIVSHQKVYIIDDSEYMTKEAQNSLLKTIEEPPEFVTIILITANENKILNTIQSRCLKLYFQNISNDEIKQYLKEMNQTEEISENILKASNGSIGKAIQIQKQKENYVLLDKVFSDVHQYTLTQARKELEILYKDKENIQELLEYINVIFFNKAKKDIQYLKYIQLVEQVKRKLNLNCNYDMSIDSLLFHIW